jgi:hypothetical protein
MATPAGRIAYTTDEAPVAACGLCYTAEELHSVLNGAVGASARDDAGVEHLTDFLAAVTETDFKCDALRKVFDTRPQLEDWRVCEVIAEVYLTDHRGCFFPWTTARNLRDSKASLPGTDLVGFRKTNEAANPHRFVFGEVKTSSDDTVPPNVMYGRHGLKQQVEELRDSKPTRDTLFLYLGWRAPGSPWADQYRHAASRYLADSSDVAIFGVLVRDVPPDAGDLRSRAKSLAKDCPASMCIELIALYLPAKAINGIGARCASLAEGSHANN